MVSSSLAHKKQRPRDAQCKGEPLSSVEDAEGDTESPNQWGRVLGIMATGRLGDRNKTRKLPKFASGDKS
jgi:hypothetical protein